MLFLTVPIECLECIQLDLVNVNIGLLGEAIQNQHSQIYSIIDTLKTVSIALFIITTLCSLYLILHHVFYRN